MTAANILHSVKYMKRTRLGEFEIVVLAALVKLADQAYGMAVRQEIESTTGQPVSMISLVRA